ncbi:TetR/AcrR family transcriptional regulator [Cellulomonas marina]|uniref:DNA-binding transcriptional regulator, AcrR family n=1 Tax=Cellulomonas marina TaxID=988821 RepID=A0A1I0WS64_9CELL|nr:TetR/AcrR family transcriptional regulator [Cellulomonas marina]GIG27837.1 TetR family transcriptional regulator [Cellulomonas marina]SFA91374.1 DNA-binding transcriptional regulator, AcrR family [Cellulomonas marina]
MAPGGATRRSDAARNRAHLLEVARRQVCDGSPLPALKDLARLAGVGTGTAYRHFPTQHALLAALGEEGTRRLVADVRAGGADPDPAAGFARVVGVVVRGVLHDDAVRAALTGAGPGAARDPGPAAELDEAVGLLLRRARAAGAVRPDVDADDIPLLVLGLAAGLAPVADDDGRVERHVQVLLDGLRPPRRAERRPV